METNTTEPEWNDQISFVEMFPPLSRKIKVQVLDDASVRDVAIATHYIYVQEISDPDRNGEAWHGCLGAGCLGQPCAMHFLLGMLVSWGWEQEWLKHADILVSWAVLFGEVSLQQHPGA